MINLPHLDVAPEPPGTDFHGGTRTLVCWQILGWSASGMHRLACVPVCILCSICIPFSGKVQCKMHSTYNIICLPNTTHFNIQGTTFNAASEMDYWAWKGVDQRTFGPIATPLPEEIDPKQSPLGLRGVQGSLILEISTTDVTNKQNSKSMSPGALHQKVGFKPQLHTILRK